MHSIYPNNIPQMEAALASRGIPVSEMCRLASVAETTWGRWKRKEVSPTFRSWDPVVVAFQKLTSDEQRERASA